MKVDVALLRYEHAAPSARRLDLLKAHYRLPYTLATLPEDDKATYDMLSRADSVGVFQVESTAPRMSMPPRLKPAEKFYDLCRDRGRDVAAEDRSRETWFTSRQPRR